METFSFESWDKSPEKLKAITEYAARIAKDAKYVDPLEIEMGFPLSVEFRAARLAFKNRIQPGKQKADH